MTKKKCVLRILDEVNCVFLGLTKEHYETFSDAYATYAKNYFFNPKYKLGSWDGKIRFFGRNGKTYVNLLDNIIPVVTNLGYKLEIDDRRKPHRVVNPDPIHVNYFKDKGVTHPVSGEPWIIRDYQVGMVNTLFEAGGGVGIAGTGAGKTSMTAALALSYEEAANFRSIIIVPDKGLTIQTLEEYKNFTLDVGQYGAGILDGDHQHVVSTWQTLQNHPSFIEQFQVVVVDEAHGLRGPVLQEILNAHGKDIPYRYGVTGTLPKHETDARAIYVTVGPTRCEIPAHQLQKEQHLADLQINIYKHKMGFEKAYREYLQVKREKPVTYRKFCDDYFPDYQAEKKYLQTEPMRMEWIADFMKVQHELGNGNILCLVNGVAFGKKLAKMIDGAIFLSGGDKVEVRREAYNLFKDRNDVTVIATINIAGTGLDIPRIFQLIGIDLGKSFERVIQAIGRGLRKAQDKDKVIFSDVTSDLKYSRKHLSERKKYYAEAQYRFKEYDVEMSDDDDDPQEDFFN